MAYKFDEDLEFLRELKSSDLNELVDILKGKDGDGRMTEELSAKDDFKKFYPDHQRYIELICEELQLFGGNTFANMFRGHGLLYKEILCDVCDKLKVNYNKSQNTQMIEQGLFMKILSDSLDKMSEEDLKNISSDLGLKTTNFTSQAVMGALQVAIKGGGFMSYKIALIVANTIANIILGRGLSLAANATFTRTISIFAGPIGWLITGVWTAADIAGPAYRVTIPAVIQVAFLRQVYLNKGEEC
ncbi:DUF3944 domain-containing protein [Campylobacter showae]|jgi:UPF0174 protein HP_1588|uniref:DUF3944 domain-containing protein n=1 Tax=Campylobacter showae TaxID=204 RepID=UPI000F089AA8|nr:DUF3944 domain-containing protein [Campylobacter showae]